MMRQCGVALIFFAGCGGAAPSAPTAAPPERAELRIALPRAVAVGTSWTEEASVRNEPTSSCGTERATRVASGSARVTVVTAGTTESLSERWEIGVFEIDRPTLEPGTLIDVDRSSHRMSVAGVPVEGADARVLRQVVDLGFGEPGSELGWHLSAFPSAGEVELGGTWAPDRARLDPILTATRSDHPWTGPLDARAQLLEVVDTEGGPAQRITIHTRVDTTDLPAEGRVVQEGHVAFDIEVLVPVDRRFPILEDRFEVNGELTYVLRDSGEVCHDRLQILRTHRRSAVVVPTAATE